MTVNMNSNVTGTGFSEVRGYTATIVSADDGDDQNIYGYFANIETHPNDNGYGFYARSNSTNSTGGTQYGLRIRLDDADATRYGIYQETDNPNYFAGSIGFDISSPSYRLQLPNSSTNSVGRAQANQWATYSDGRFKTNVVPVTNALDKVSRLNGVTYNWLGQDDGPREVGFIAQEVAAVMPEAVSIGPGTATGADGEEVSVDDYHSLDYGRIAPLLVEAIKEQQAQIEKLEAANDNLAQEIEKLKAQTR